MDVYELMCLRANVDVSFSAFVRVGHFERVWEFFREELLELQTGLHFFRDEESLFLKGVVVVKNRSD